MEEWQGRVSCCICLVNEKDASWVALECGHVFHMACVAQALEHQRACPTCRKKCRREPLRLFVNNEPCNPSDNAGGQLSDVGLDLQEASRKFKETLDQHRRWAAHATQELEGKLEDTQKELQEKTQKLKDLKAKNSDLKQKNIFDESRWREAEKRTAAKEEELIRAQDREKSLLRRMKDMEDDHTRQLNGKESEVLRLKNEKKRGIWSSNQRLTYEQILEMSNTSEERESVNSLAQVLAQRNAELQELKAQRDSLEKAKQQLEAGAALREAELKRELQSQVTHAMKQRDGERLQVNRLESELGIVQGQLNEAKEQLESQGLLLEDALQSAGQSILLPQPLRQQRLKNRQTLLQVQAHSLLPQQPDQQVQQQRQQQQQQQRLKNGQTLLQLQPVSHLQQQQQQQQQQWDQRQQRNLGLSPPGLIQSSGVMDHSRDCGEEDNSMAGLDMLAMEEGGPQDEWPQPHDHHRHHQQQQQQEQRMEQQGLQQQQQQQQQQDVHVGLLGYSQEQNLGVLANDATRENEALQSQGCASQLQGSISGEQEPLSRQDWRSMQEDGVGSMGPEDPVNSGEDMCVGFDGLDEEEGVFRMPQVPGRLRTGAGLMGVSRQQQLQQRRQRQQQQRGQLGVDQGAGVSPSAGCLMDITNAADPLQPALPNKCVAAFNGISKPSAGGGVPASGASHRGKGSIPSCSARGSLLGPVAQKPSFVNSSMANNARHGGFAPHRASSGSLIRDGPDGKGGIKRHYVPSDVPAVVPMGASSRPSGSGPSSFVGAKMPHSAQPAKKQKKPASVVQYRMDKFLTKQ